LKKANQAAFFATAFYGFGCFFKEFMAFGSSSHCGEEVTAFSRFDILR